MFCSYLFLSTLENAIDGQGPTFEVQVIVALKVKSKTTERTQLSGFLLGKMGYFSG